MNTLTRGMTLRCKNMATTPQKEVLEKNSHFVPVQMMADRDILVIDAEGFGPYIILKNGHVQAVDYHYKHYHGLDIKTQWERQNEQKD